MTNPDGISSRSRRLTRIWLSVAVGSYTLPVVLDFLLSDERQAFRYVAADAFYYLTIARNIAETGVATFDQVHSTNGFHPLWQMLLTLVYGVGQGLGVPEHGILTATVLVNVLLIALALVLLGRAMTGGDGRLSPLFITLPVGAYALVISPLWWQFNADELVRQNPLEGSQPLYGTLWSYANGMESGVLLFMFAIVAHWYVEKPVLRSRWQAFVFGALLALYTFARLDHIFLPLAIVFLLAVRCALRQGRDEWRHVLLIGGTFAALVGSYLLVNRLAFGSAVPISGSLKSTFPHVSTSFLHLSADLVGNVARGKPWLYLAWRLTQILLPVLAAVAYLGWAFRIRNDGGKLALESRRPAGRFDFVMTATALAVICLAICNVLFVRWGRQGHWYFPVSVLFVGLTVVWILDHRGVMRKLETSGRGLWVWTVVVTGVTLIYFVALHRQPEYHARYADFYFDEAPRVRAFYGDDPPGLLSFDDGIVAFATGFPTMSGIGLALDAEAVPHYKSHSLAELAVERGYDRMTSLVYVDMRGLKRPGVSSAMIEKWIRNKFRGFRDPSRYDFSVEYRSASSGFVIVRVMAR